MDKQNEPIANYEYYLQHLRQGAFNLLKEEAEELALWGDTLKDYVLHPDDPRYQHIDMAKIMQNIEEHKRQIATTWGSIQAYDSAIDFYKGSIEYREFKNKMK